MTIKFNNKDGSLTKYAFLCGYIEKKTNGENRISLSLDSIYHVKGMINGSRLWECFDNLTQARKFYKSIALI
jgi:hypothetical protein